MQSDTDEQAEKPLADVTDANSALNEIYRVAQIRKFFGLSGDSEGIDPVRWDKVAAMIKVGVITLSPSYSAYEQIRSLILECPDKTDRNMILDTLETWAIANQTTAIPDIANEAINRLTSDGRYGRSFQDFVEQWDSLRSDAAVIAAAINHVATSSDSTASLLKSLTLLNGSVDDATRLHNDVLARRHHPELDAAFATLLYDWSAGSLWGQYQYQRWLPDDPSSAAHRVVEPSIATIAAVVRQLPLDISGIKPDIELLALAPQSRMTWRGTLRAAVDACPELRAVVVKDILRFATNQADELVQYAVIELLMPDRLEILEQFTLSHVPRVALRAKTVLEMVLGTQGAAEAMLAHANPAPTQRNNAAKTWLGDATAEAVIERAFADAACDLAKEVRTTADSGEESLVAILFERLRNEARNATKQLASIAKETRAADRVRVSLERRIIGKTEEGRQGLADDHDFSTDVCLLFRATRGPAVFAERATFIQAKRLMRDKTTLDELYKIDMAQMKDISEQTAASYLLLVGPEVSGVTIPVIPARLAIDYLDADSGHKTLRPQVAARIGRSMAPWLVSEVIGLWTGDPRVEAIDKAAGSVIGRPTTIFELTVSVVPTGPDDMI